MPTCPGLQATTAASANCKGGQHQEDHGYEDVDESLAFAWGW
jgi:hypothetical protein